MNTHIRRGKIADVEESRKVVLYLELENKPKMKREIIEGALISEDHFESCLNFLKHVNVVKEERVDGKKYYIVELKKW